MKRFFEKIAVMIAAMLLAAAPGCDGQSGQGGLSGDTSTRSQTYLARNARPVVADIPVPYRFHLDEDRSRDVSAAGQRWIDHVYTGSADKFSVREFYLNEMPKYRWVLVTKSFIQGQVTLDFKKDAETCRVTVGDANGLFGEVMIKVFVLTSGPIREPAGADVE